MNTVLLSETKDVMQMAAEWRLLSLLLERPKQNWLSEIQALAAEVQDPQLRLTGNLAEAATEEEYIAWLGPASFVSPREVAYAGFEDPGQLLSRLMTFYKVFAFDPKVEDPQDHISVESGFVGYLCLKEAYAGMSENLEAVETTRAAREKFVQEHLARLIRGMSAKLNDSAPPYLLMTMEALIKRIKHLPESPLPQVKMDADPVGCACSLESE